MLPFPLPIHNVASPQLLLRVTALFVAVTTMIAATCAAVKWLVAVFVPFVLSVVLSRMIRSDSTTILSIQSAVWHASALMSTTIYQQDAGRGQ